MQFENDLNEKEDFTWQMNSGGKAMMETCAQLVWPKSEFLISVGIQ
jgi:hypothetical protein